jgi:hypothetical protein
LFLPAAGKDTDIACSGITGHVGHVGHVGQVGHAGHSTGLPEIRLKNFWNDLSSEEAAVRKWNGYFIDTIW